MPKHKVHKVALITGAAQGIGASIAEALGLHMDALVLLDIQPGFDAVTGQIGTTPTKRYVCDVGDAQAVARSLKQASDTFGAPNVLVNNAGKGGPFHRVDEVSDDEWFSLMATNLKSVFNLSRALLPGMKQEGFGRIVNIASVQGYLGAARSSTYVAAKHGVIGYTRAIAAEWGAYGITCNAICPGYVGTEMGLQDGEVDDHTKRVLSATPAGRIARPEEIASLVRYLVGPDSSFMNGSVLTIDGGLTSHVGVS